MTIDKADQLCDAAFDAIKQLFRDAGRDTPQHRDVLKFAQDKYLQLGRIVTAETDPKAAIAKLDTLINTELGSQVRTGAEVRAVMAKLAASPAFRDAQVLAAPFVAPRESHRRLKQKMKRSRTTVAKAEKDAEWHVSQPEFAFENIEQFRGLPKTIRYMIPASGKEPARYADVAYIHSNRAQRESSIALKTAWNAKSADELELEKRANKVLEPLCKLYGDLTPPELWRHHMEDEKRKQRKAASKN